jgi:hypothetical protein
MNDITGKIGSMFPQVTEWPMYSFTRPACAFWQGLANGLAEQGKTEEQIKEILQSKHMRWLFDGQASEQIEALGTEIALRYGKDWKL